MAQWKARIGRRIWRVGRVIPVTLPGLVLGLGSAFVALAFAKSNSDYLLYAAALLALGLLAACTLFVVLTTALLWRQLRRLPSGLPETLEAESSTDTSFRLPRLRSLPLIEVDLLWDQPASVQVELVSSGPWCCERVTPRKRARAVKVVRCFSVADVFGLAAISFSVTWNTALRIVPALASASAPLPVSQAQGDLFSHPAGEPEGDLVEMRAYGPGDPLHHVLWKTFARTRRLLVRMPERALAYPSINSACLIAGESDEDSCSAARLYLEKRLFGSGFVFCADGAKRPTGDPREAIDQIIDSVKAKERGLEASSLDVLASSHRVSSCLIFVPPVDGPWRSRVEIFSSRLAVPATIVIGVSGALPQGERKFKQMLFRKDGASTDWDGLARLTLELRQCGMKVQVIHRELGEMA